MRYDSVDKCECNAEKETEIYTHAVKNLGLNIKTPHPFLSGKITLILHSTRIRN